MRTILGAAIGVFAIGLVLILFGARNTAHPQILAASGEQLTASANGSSDVGAGWQADSRQAGSASQMLVNCGPGQRSMVRQSIVAGQPVIEVDCVGEALPRQASRQAQEWTGSGAMAGAFVGDEVQYVAVRPQAQQAVIVSEPRVVQQRPVYRQAPQANRPLQKRLLIIGGSAATGAGVGGLIGGKKGALIGAAIGGGGSTIYEATR
jgi:hypothetical protein